MIKKYKTINGALTIERRDNIIIAEFQQAVDKKIMLAFNEAIAELVAQISPNPWGYISCSKHCDAATPEAEAMLVEATVLGWQTGCVSGAYVLDSIIAINQTDRVLKTAGLATGLEGKLFDEVEPAFAFVKAQLGELS